MRAKHGIPDRKTKPVRRRYAPVSRGHWSVPPNSPWDHRGIRVTLGIEHELVQILPLDLSSPSFSAASLPLQRVTSINYLGVKITRDPLEYIINNIEPLFPYLKSCIQSWARLPLGVMGRINLFKMILLPKFLYMFWNSPVLIPLKIFKTMDKIINSFIWGSNRHKLAWNTIKNPTSSGGRGYTRLIHLLHSCTALTLLLYP